MVRKKVKNEEMIIAKLQKRKRKSKFQKYNKKSNKNRVIMRRLAMAIRKRNVDRKSMCKNHRKLQKNKSKEKSIQRKHTNKKRNSPKKTEETVRENMEPINKSPLKARSQNLALNVNRSDWQIVPISKKKKPHLS